MSSESFGLKTKRDIPETSAEIVASSEGQIKSAHFSVSGTVRKPINDPNIPVVRLGNVLENFAEFDNQTDAKIFLKTHKSTLPDDACVMVWEWFV